MHSDVLSAAVAGKSPSFDQALSVMVESRKDSSELLEAAGIIRKKFKGNIVTFSSKVFINITNLCRDTCTYCTYKKEPDSTTFMEPEKVRSLARLGKKQYYPSMMPAASKSSEQIAGRECLDQNFLIRHCCA